MSAEDDILEKHGVTPDAHSMVPEDLLLADHGVGPSAIPHSDPSDHIGEAESFLRGAEQGTTLGFAPRIEAGISAATDKMIGSDDNAVNEAVNNLNDPRAKAQFLAEHPSKDLGALYNEYLKEKNDYFRKAAHDNPASSVVGNIAGGLLLPVPELGLAAKAGLNSPKYIKAAAEALEAGKAVPNSAKYAPMATKMADSAVVGSGMGAGYGLSQSPDLTNPWEDAKAMGEGATIGAGVGMSAPLAIGGVKSTAGATAELGRRVFGPLVDVAKHNISRGMRYLPNMGSSAGRAQDAEMQGEIAYGTGADIYNRTIDSAKKLTEGYNNLAAQGRQIPPEAIEGWINEQLARNPRINENVVRENLHELFNLLLNARDGEETEQVVRHFFGDGMTDMGKFKLQSEANRMVEDLKNGSQPAVNPRQAFEDQVSAKQTEQNTLGESGEPIETEYVPLENGKTLALAKQRQFTEAPAEPQPRILRSMPVDHMSGSGQIDPEQMQAAQNMLEAEQAKQRATPLTDHPELELHVEPTNMVRYEGGTPIKQSMAMVREKTPPPGGIDTGGDVDAGVKKIMSKVLAPNEVPGDSVIQKYPTSQPGKVLAVESRPIYGDDGRLIRQEVVRSKVINEENLAKWRDEKVIARPNDRNLGQFDQFMALLEALRRKSKWSPSGSGFANPESQQVANDMYKSGQALLDKYAPEMAPVRSDIHALKNVADHLGLDTYDFKNNPQMQQEVGKRIQGLISKMHEMGPAGYQARQSLKYVLDELDKVSPLWAKEVREQMNDLGTTAALSKGVDKPLHFLGDFTAIRNLAIPAAAGVGHKIGETIADHTPMVTAARNGVASAVNNIVDLTPQAIKTLAAQAGEQANQMGADRGAKAFADFATVLSKAADADQRSRNAYMFMLMARPEFRAWAEKYLPTSPEK
jgi:hypothetical protein